MMTDPTRKPSEPVDLASAEAARKAWSVFQRIAEAWELTRAEQIALLGVREQEFCELVASQTEHGLDNATLERISYVLGIYAALHALFPLADRADAWVRRPNSAPGFRGGSALEYMMHGDVSGLAAVRQYLDAQVGV